MILVSVFDVKAEIWTPPHPSQSRASAVREFETLVNDGGKTMISQHPEDFSLFLVGEWCDRVPMEGFKPGSEVKFSAKLVAMPSFECLAQGIDLVKKG